MEGLVVGLLLLGVPVALDPIGGGPQISPSVACDTTGCSIAWTQDGVREVHVRWLVPDGTLGPMSSSTMARFLFGLGAWGTRRFYLMSPDGVSGDRRAYLAATMLSGAPINTAPPLQIDDGANSWLGSQSSFCPGPTWGLLGYGIVDTGGWNKVKLRRVSNDGGFPDPTSTQITQGGNEVLDAQIVELGGNFWMTFFDRIDGNQLDPYLSVFDSALVPVVDHVQLRSTTSNERGGVLAGRADHLLAGWIVNAARLDVVRLPLDGGVVGPLLTMPQTWAARWSWRGDAGVLATASATDGGDRLAADLLFEEADGGLTRTPLSAQTWRNIDGISVGHLTDEQAALAFSAVNDAGVSRVYVAVQGLRLLGESCTAPASCAVGTCAGGLCVMPGSDGGIDAGSDGGTDAGSDGGSTASPDAGVDDPSQLHVHCGCGSSPGLLLLLVPARWLCRRARSGGPRSEREAGRRVRRR